MTRPRNIRSIVFIETPLSLKQRYGEMASAAHLVPPLGLMSLAAVTREAGYATEILDGAALGLTVEQVVEELVHRKPDVIGMTCATVGFSLTAALASRLKEQLPDVITILGGVHATALPELTLESCPQFDFVAIGEGEETLLELLSCLKNGQDPGAVKGIAYRAGDVVVVTPRRPPIKDLDRLPMPAWDLVPNLIEHYHPAPHIFRRLPSTTISTSRGCFGQCTFCDRSVFGTRCRGYSAEYLVRMLEYLIELYGLKDVWIGDDLFVMFRSRLQKVCQLLIERKLDLTWACCARVGMLTPEVLAMMKKAGCYEIAFGIESGDQRMLDSLKKDIRLEDVRRDLTWTKKAGIRTAGTFMIGVPNETRETMEASIRFAKDIDLDMLQLSFFTPFPGSELSRDIEKFGTLDRDYSKMNVFGNIVFVPNGMTREDLITFYKRFYREFYLRPKTVLSFLRDLESPRDLIAYAGGALAVMKLAFSRKKNSY